MFQYKKIKLKLKEATILYEIPQSEYLYQDN